MPAPCRGDLESAAQGLGKVSRDAQALVRQDRALTPAARRLTAGPVPSIDACLEGLHDIWCALAGLGRTVNLEYLHPLEVPVDPDCPRRSICG